MATTQTALLDRETMTMPVAAETPPNLAVKMSASLAAKIASIMKKLDTGIEKTGRNWKQNYEYLEASVVTNRIRPLLAENNIAIFTSVVGRDEKEIESASGNRGIRVVLHLAHTFVDGDTGESFTVYMDGEGQDYGDKATNKAYTTGLKYLLLNTFVIGSQDDPEADETTDSDPVIASPKASPKASPTALLTKLQNTATELGWDSARLHSWAKGITKREYNAMTPPQIQALIKLLQKEATNGNS